MQESRLSVSEQEWRQSVAVKKRKGVSVCDSTALFWIMKARLVKLVRRNRASPTGNTRIDLDTALEHRDGQEECEFLAHCSRLDVRIRPTGVPMLNSGHNPPFAARWRERQIGAFHTAL